MLGREDIIAAARKLWGPENAKLSSQNEMRFGSKGSKSLDLEHLVWHDHEEGRGGGVVDLCQRAGLTGNGTAHATPWITYDYRDEAGTLLFQVCRTGGTPPFVQRRPNGTDWIFSLGKTRRVLYRLPQLLGADASEPVFICEGEKDADNLARLGLVATTNPGGAGKWRGEFSINLKGRDCVILPDNDEAGRSHARKVARALDGLARSVIELPLPGLGAKEDVSDWIARGGTAEALRALAAAVAPTQPAPSGAPVDGLTLDDFFAYAPEHNYIFRPTGQRWPAGSVNGRLGKVGAVKASLWLDQNKPVEQMTWSPGDPALIKDKLVADGGWFEKKHTTVFNLYHPPNLVLGDAMGAERWVEHVRKVYPDDAGHLIQWLAYRCQHPHIKINHAIFLGGAPGIGKDTLLEPVRRCVGYNNCATITPTQLLGRFNGFVKSVILLITEARDLGDVNRPQFYEHTKLYTASPPEVILVDEKNTHPYYVPNITGVIITSNHKAGGIYLPPDDRRTYVAWSPVTMADFEDGYFIGMWNWFDAGGYADIAAYLMQCDVTEFDPKAPPPKTAAFWDIVAASRAPESSEMADTLDLLGRPDVVTLHDIQTHAANQEFADWLKDRRNRRAIPAHLERCGYVNVPNEEDKHDHQWRIMGKRQSVYARQEMTYREQVIAVRKKRDYSV